MNEQIGRFPEGGAEKALLSLSEHLRENLMHGSRLRQVADDLVDLAVRDAFLQFRVNVGPELPEEIPFQIDHGKLGKTPLLFNTRDINVRAVIGGQRPLNGNARGVGWFSYLDPILDAIKRELSYQKGL